MNYNNSQPTKVVWHRVDITTPEFSTFTLRTSVVKSSVRLPEAIAQCEPHMGNDGRSLLYAFVDITPIVCSSDAEGKKQYTNGISTLWWFGSWVQVPVDLTNPVSSILILSANAAQASIEIGQVFENVLDFARQTGQPIKADCEANAASPFDMVVRTMSRLRRHIENAETSNIIHLPLSDT